MPTPHVILYVEDEPMLREMLSIELAEAGYEVVGAPDGEAALAVLAQRRVDVVISDLMMPRRGGLALLEAMRQAHDLTPFIILTGHGTKDASIRALRLGAFDFLEKPFDGDALLRVTRDAAAVSRRQAEVADLLARRLAASPAVTGREDVKELAHMMSLLGKAARKESA